MICPMLSQSSRDREGNVAWDHHECIEDACAFWVGDLHDCGIRASGLVTITRAKAALAMSTRGEGKSNLSTEPLLEAVRAKGEGPTLSSIVTAVESTNTSLRDTGLKLLEGVVALEEPLKATGHELGGRIEALNAAVLSVTTSLEGRFSRVEGNLAGLKSALAESASARPAYFGELEGALAALTRRLGGISDRFSSLTQSLETVSTQVSALREAHEAISSSLSEEAERRTQDERRRHRDDARGLNTRGVGLFHRGAIDAAAGCFRAALEMDPAFAEAHNNLGLALGKQGKQQEAEECFRKALELDPSMAQALNNLGFLFHQGMEFEKAVDFFRRSALDGEDSSLAYTNLGNACYKLGRYGEAVDAWKKALEQNPLNESATRALRMFQQEPPRPA